MKKVKWLAALLAALLLCVLCAGCGGEKTGEEKSITVTVVHRDGTEKEFSVTTDKDNLGDALLDAHIVRGDNGAYGLFITTADDEAADSTKEEWWLVSKDGVGLEVSASQTEIAEGDVFELTFMTGYE